MIFKYILLFFSGVVAGFVNVSAGAGSLITIPALIFFGLPPGIANGTNRLSIFAGSLTSMIKFHRKGKIAWELAFILAVPALLGALVGSNIVVRISENLLKIILSSVMLIVLVIFFLNIKDRLKTLTYDLSLKTKIILGIIFFFIGMYGGFIQTGVGILIIAALALFTELSLVRINGVKMFVVVMYTIVSLPVFIIHKKINIIAGLVLSSGSILGFYLGSAFAIKKGDRWIRIILISVVVLVIIKLLIINNLKIKL